MEYFGNTLCISANSLVENGVMTHENYKKMAARGRLTVVRRGGGSGCPALVAVNSLPDTYKKKVKELYPNSNTVLIDGWFRTNYEIDQQAVAFYHDSAKTGVELPEDKIQEYINNASTLNTCIKLYERAKEAQKLMGNRYDWDRMATCIASLKKQFGHTLPTSTLRFRKKVNEYKKYGYICLVSGKFGNQSARKVDYKTEQLIIGIACLPNKPYNTDVHEMYNQFVTGELEVYDVETGELFNPDDFTDKAGNPKELSEATISNYLNKPKNRVLIDSKMMGYTTFYHEQMPHVHRHAPEFSFSKITMDDRDLPRKLKDTKQRPKAYYAYDMASDAVVGFAYNRNKNVDLVVDMFRSMFRLIDRKGWNCPAQVEVENHLMTQWKDNFLKAGVVFPFVRFCAPQNSQEKGAENRNRVKKYTVEHKNHVGVGRFYAKLRQNRTEAVKVFDDLNNTYTEKNYYSWDELIADDMRDVMEYNNALHHNQKKYPGKTRWEVLCENMNPTLSPLNKEVLARYIGEHVKTSIRRNSYCRVAYADWWISNTEVLEKLQPNNYEVDAYYLTNDEGEITDVFIYQDGNYIDTLTNVGTFNTADCEQTQEDKDIFRRQMERISEFKSYLKENAVANLGVSKVRKEPLIDAKVLELPTYEEVSYDSYLPDVEDYARKALEDF